MRSVSSSNLQRALTAVLFSRSAEDTKYKFPYETGPEFQIIDEDNYPDTSGSPRRVCGANYGMYAPKIKASRPIR